MKTIDWFRWLLIFFELLAFVTGLFCRKKYARTYWQYFILFLGIIFFNEMISMYFLKVLGDKELNNYFFRFYGIPIQFFFYFWLFYRYFLKEGYRQYRFLPVISTVIYLLSFCADFIVFTEREEYWFSSFSYTVGNLLLLVLILVFLLRFSRSDEIVHYSRSNMFWVSVGLLVFFLGTFPYFGLINLLYGKYRNIFVIYRYFQLILDCCMYLLFSISLLWGKTK